jgi:NAD(P)-dependent dehydrogenase (short-subunit alcohol dehydrogenase family)
LHRYVAECGASVIVTCRSTNAELEGMARVQVIEGCDVTDTASVAKMAEAVTEPVDILINNVGGGCGGGAGGEGGYVGMRVEHGGWGGRCLGPSLLPERRGGEST